MWMIRRVHTYIFVFGLLGLVVDLTIGSLPLYFAVGMTVGLLSEGARRLGWIPPEISSKNVSSIVSSPSDASSGGRPRPRVGD